MSTEYPIKFGNTEIKLDSTPVPAEWVLEGAPVARSKYLSISADGTARTIIWDCTSGRFNWFYNIDETVYVLKGSVSVKDEAGITRTAFAGDTIFFPAGSRAEWTVDTYIRKLAFCRTALPSPLVLVLQLRRRIKRLVNRLTGKAEPPAMFGGP